MKKLALIISAIVIFPFVVISQPCLPDGIIFTSQSQINNFQINHPNCTEIEGNVEIQGWFINNLNGLNVVKSIGGDLNIFYDPLHGTMLKNLIGLDSLTSIGGNLCIAHNGSLESLTGLESLTSIGNEILIIGNDLLSNLSGLENVTSVGGSIKIGGWHNGNDSLKDLTGLEGLTIVMNHLFITDNNSLSNLIGLENITSVGGEIRIEYNDNLNSLAGLDNMTSIGEDLVIYRNYALASLTGLDNVTSIGGELRIEWNGGLTSLSGLDNLTFIGDGLLLIHNRLLSICDQPWFINYLSNPNGRIEIWDNSGTCSSVVDLAIVYGPIPCLPFGDYHLTKQSDIDKFQTTFPDCNELGGSLAIHGEDIDNLLGLNSVYSITNSLFIGAPSYYTGSTSAQNLEGLNNLTSVGNECIIWDNDSLVNISALKSLIFIGYSLSIYDNESLTSLDGLDNTVLDSLEDLEIVANLSLSQCEVLSICNYLSILGVDAYIADNAIGCNSPEEVQDSCEANGINIEENYILEEFLISPNPFTTSTTLSYTLNKSSTVTISIFNPQGQLIEKIERVLAKGEQQVHWNAEGLPAGMYYFRMQAGDKVGGGKMVKMR